MAFKERIRVLVKEPGRRPRQLEIPNTMEAFQWLVSGFFETIPFDDKSVLICNEEGKIKGLRENFRIWNDIIVGTVVLAGAEGEDFTDVPEASEETFRQILEEQKR